MSTGAWLTTLDRERAPEPQALRAIYAGFEASTLKAARALRNKLQGLLLALSNPRSLRRVLRDTLDYLHHNAGRAQPRRDRVDGPSRRPSFLG